MPVYSAPTKDMSFILHNVLNVNNEDIAGYCHLKRERQNR